MFEMCNEYVQLIHEEIFIPAIFHWSLEVDDGPILHGQPKVLFMKLIFKKSKFPSIRFAQIRFEKVITVYHKGLEAQKHKLYKGHCAYV